MLTSVLAYIFRIDMHFQQIKQIVFEKKESTTKIQKYCSLFPKRSISCLCIVELLFNILSSETFEVITVYDFRSGGE